MAVTNQSALLKATYEISSYPKQSPSEVARQLYFRHVQAGDGDATSDVILVRFPAGIVHFSLKFFHSAFGALRVLDVGFGTHNEYETATPTHLPEEITADPDAFADDIDVAAAGFQSVEGHVQSIDGVDLLATVGVDTIPDTAVLEGFVTFVVEPYISKGRIAVEPE